MKEHLTILLLTTICIEGSVSGAQPQEGEALWSYGAGSTILSSPTLGVDGSVYIGTAYNIQAVTNNGSTASNKWSLPYPVNSSPAVAVDGTIYFGSGPTFYSIRPDGSQKWSISLSNSSYVSTPAIGPDGKVYFVCGGKLRCISSKGEQEWATQIDSTSDGGALAGPVLGLDNSIYVGSSDSFWFYAIGPDGTQKWKKHLADAPSESAAVQPDGHVYISATYVYAFSGSGSPTWTNSTWGLSPAAIGPSGTIYVADVDRALTAISPAGETKWQVLRYAVRFPTSTPAVDVTERIYYCTSNRLFAVAAAGNVEWVFVPPMELPYEQVTSPIIGGDGTIYVGIHNTLYAICNTNRPADTYWPMYHQNARHTGRIDKPSIRKPQKRADANFQFQIYDTLGNTNTVQASSDLALWTSLTDIVITNIPVDFIDYTASNFASRFYCTIQQ